MEKAKSHGSMPETKGEKILFGILMSVLMTGGMEVYNNAIQMGYATLPGGLSNMRNGVFLAALGEVWYMCVIVFVISEAFGNRIGHALASRIIRPEKDNPFFITLIISGCTVLIMCPTMSLVACILFNICLGGAPVTQLPAIWVGTVLKNFLMALLWNLFAAGPLTRLIFRGVCRRNIQLKSAEDSI